MLWAGLESHDKDMEELRTKVPHQSDCYNDLWLVHQTSAKGRRSYILGL